MAVITPGVYASMGLNAGEYRRILELMGREPTLTELGMFAVMWSEHCGYKYSRPILAYFARYKEALEGKGFENAGVVDIGDGWGVTMKVESHNHPSAVEPYQGAATGVGGIIRDILTMGARPIASLNSLRFGPIRETNNQSEATLSRNRYLFEHIVAGIAGYGNCVGVPTVGGEVDFHPRYSGNPLVNAMCVGILRLDQITTAAASGAGNPVLYLGSSTGKDGIHGATFASAELDEASESKRPNVQIGDPFAEKLLIEATLEALATGAVVAIQDMGAAGLTCSTIEMSAKGEVGMAIDLDRVPMREADMSAYELMLSESQERMLAIAHRGREHEVIDVFRKWGLHAVVIGHVTDDRLTTIRRFGRIEAQLQATWLADNCPTYHPAAEIPEYYERAKAFDPTKLPIPDLHEALLKLLASPTIASKRWVYRQYDQTVQTQTSLIPGQGDAAVLAPRGTRKGLALKIDGNSRQVYLDPYVGAQLAVCEAARNVSCVGGLPTAVTDGLNFGSPEDPHVFWQFSEAVKGIADAAEAMGTPVISGNVSFYNESELGEVPPTPVIGMLGIILDVTKQVGLAPKGDRGDLYLISTRGSGFRASAALAEDDPVYKSHGGYLPHWTQKGGIYTVRFWLADSVPSEIAEQWRKEREELEIAQQKNTLSPHQAHEAERLLSHRIDAYLDSGHGACLLKRPEVAQIVRDALFLFDGDRYWIHAWCVMPNHVQVLFEPSGEARLEDILHSWKSFSSNAINKLLERTGTLWQKESYDHLARDAGDYANQRASILSNPDMGRLADWPWVGATALRLEAGATGLGASAYLAEIHGIEDGVPAPPNVVAERRLCELLVDAIQDGLVSAAHDCSEGGLAVALAEMVIAKQARFDVELDHADRLDAALYGEWPGRVIVSVEDEAAGMHLIERAKSADLEICRIGSFEPGFLLGIRIDEQRLEWPGLDLWHNHCGSIEHLIEPGA